MKKIAVFSLVLLLGLGHFAYASSGSLCGEMAKTPKAGAVLNALRDCCRSGPCDCAIKAGVRIFERVAESSSPTPVSPAVSGHLVSSVFIAPSVPAVRDAFFRPPASPGAVLALYSVFRI